MNPSAPAAVPPLMPASARRGLALLLLLAHGAVLLAWLTSPPARRALAQVAPVVVRLISADPANPQAPPVMPLPAAQPARPAATPLPVPDVPPVEAAHTQASPALAPVASTATAVPAAPTLPAPAAAPAGLAAEPAAPPAPPPAAPRTVQISAVAYLQPPVLDYPPPSRRQGEEGLVQVRVLIGADGLPHQMIVLRSSGFPRLDEAALAAVRATRFRPYTENGQAVPVWVVMPLLFELQA